jgi:superfamily I DNA/RNA helicase
MVGDIVKQNINFLRALSGTRSKKRRKYLLKHASASELLALVEICYNILNGCLKLNTWQRKSLRDYAEIIRRLSRLRSEKGAKKLIISKEADIPLNFFSLLIRPVISTLDQHIPK